MSEPTDGPSRIEPKAGAQAGQQQVRLRVNESQLTTNYSNAFRSNASTEELIIDFGINMIVPNPGVQAGGQPAAEIVFNASDRVVMNYYTAKRLAMMLSQVVAQHESQFGELNLNRGNQQAARAAKQ